MPLLTLPPPTALAGPTTGLTGAAVDSRPNIVLITTDDQTLADLRAMPITRRVLKSKGVSFNGLSPHPLCCPARAEILTGQFAQNNGVIHNFGPHGGYPAFNPSSTVATWLDGAGYTTAFLGKFLNGYDDSLADTGSAPGWDRWHPTVAGIYNYTDFTIDHNGTRAKYVDAYQTDVYADLAGQLLTQFATEDKPFFMWQSLVAPHTTSARRNSKRVWVPPVPAARHRDMFPGAVPPAFADPSFNETDVSDKPSWVQQLVPLDDVQKAKQIRSHRKRLRALQAVDEAVGRVVGTLRRTGELESTLVIFTSDNGFLLGEHRATGKNVPYEPALQVPLLMRGPGVPTGVTLSDVGATVDIAPTIAAAAEATPTLTVDGRNLLPVAQQQEKSWSTLLIQAGANQEPESTSPWFFRGVRTERYTYVHYPQTGERELYDRHSDPGQLDNVAGAQRYAAVQEELDRRYQQLSSCAGTECREEFGPEPPVLNSRQ